MSQTRSCLPRIVVALIGLLAACGKDRELPRYVKDHCHEVAVELRGAASKSSEVDGMIAKGITPEQQTRAESLLLVKPSLDGRGAWSLEVMRSLSFCARVRDIDDSRRDKLSDAVGVTTQEVREGDRSKMTAGLAKLAAVAEEIDGLPIRD